MRGMNSATGHPVDGINHLRQSIRDILTTRVGTRVMRRDYGSDVPAIIDSPANEEFAVDLYVAVADALDKWEPRFKLREISMVNSGAGVVEMSLTGVYLPDGKAISLDGIVVK